VALALLAGLVVLGVAVRLRYFLACPSYWYDEAYLLLSIFHRSFSQLLGPLELSQAAPPVFLWIERALYQVAGPAEEVMRFFPFVASLAALALMFPLARRVVSGPGWAWAVGFCALCRHGLTHAVEVKPYSSDVLVSEAILLATAVCLLPETSPRGWRWGLVSLFVLALLAPWLSFPSVFILGGASLGLLVEAWRRRRRSGWVYWVAFNLLVVLSFAGLWAVAARHENFSYLQEAWAPHFLDTSSPGAALLWTADCLVGIGNYGTTGLGVLLVILSVPGLVRLWARNRSLAVLLLGPLALAWVAGALRQYPLGDRLVFFAVPCIWLLAAAGVGAVADCLPARRTWAGWAVLGLLLVPGITHFSKCLFVVGSKAEFRQAFAYVHQRRSPGDTLWVAYPEVYEVYYGRQPGVLSCYTRAEGVRQAAQAGRLWVVIPPAGEVVDRTTPFPEMDRGLRAAHSVLAGRYQVEGLEIRLYQPGSSRRNW
jgi:hypothetical protein